MTKSPHSVTRLRLFKLYRLLALLCVFKLCLFGALLLDVDWGKVHEDVRDVAQADIRPDDDAAQEMTASAGETDTEANPEDAVPEALAAAKQKARTTARSSEIPFFMAVIPPLFW